MISNRKIRPTRNWLRFQIFTPVVESMLEEGYSPRQIHEGLSREGYLSISYKTFSVYLRLALRRGDEPGLVHDEDAIIQAIDVMESVERKGCIRYGLKQIYQGLIKCGMENISYSAFCGFIRDGGKLLPVRILDEDFVFTDDDDFFLLTEKMAALLSAEADSVCRGFNNQEEK